jgi:hypothetical protein
VQHDNLVVDASNQDLVLLSSLLKCVCLRFHDLEVGIVHSLTFLIRAILVFVEAHGNDLSNVGVGDRLREIDLDVRLFEVLDSSHGEALLDIGVVCLLTILHVLLGLYRLHWVEGHSSHTRRHRRLRVLRSLQGSRLTQVQIEKLSFVLLALVLVEEESLALAFGVEERDKVGQWLHIQVAWLNKSADRNLLDSLGLLLVQLYIIESHKVVCGYHKVEVVTKQEREA